ncbi:hypothetical protein PR202_ga14455 [Eleusine coracana subsp. coracana]|uniref:GST C-terminal domain-containing protein n=1 Tax=Eleusine coracana subsp. coracana TaxID=191504 RepID=A0AAV5CGN3_ELECO|nr:hypothetical protein PR202_ga14455 [Eleusine coracana subsp. coracana]
MKILDAQLQLDLDGKIKRRFFGGEKLGYVDIAACSLAHWLYVMEEAAGVRLVADGEYPALRRWAKEYVSDQAVKRCLPDRDKLVAFYAANKEKFRSEIKAILQQ